MEDRDKTLEKKIKATEDASEVEGHFKPRRGDGDTEREKIHKADDEPDVEAHMLRKKVHR